MTRFAAGQRVSRERPCPVCGKPDWCAFSSDGRFVHCQRSEEWNGKRAVRQTDAGWLHALDDRAPQRISILPSLPTPVRASLPRAVLDAVYRRVAGLCGLDEFAEHDLINARRFPEALDGGAIYFSLPGAGTRNAEVSEAVVAEFGLGVIERVAGFSIACKSCESSASRPNRTCSQCKGSGRTAPRFRSVRGARHDYGLIACDEDGMAFWGLSRKLPFDEAKEKNKYLLLSSSRETDASVAGLPKYHVAGRQYPTGEEVWITEGVIKAEIAARRLQRRVIGIYSTSVDAPTLAEVCRLIERWQCAS